MNSCSNGTLRVSPQIDDQALLNMEQKRIVHICYPSPASGWVLRLLSGIHASPSAAIKERLSQNWESRLSEVALAVSSKIEIVGASARRVNDAVHRISAEVQQRNGELEDLIGTDGCLSIMRPGQLIETLLDIESFLFEMHSALEITECFLKLFRRFILSHAGARQETLPLCFTSLEIDQSWFDRLNIARNLFSHQIAPWLALDIQTLDPCRFDLILLKRNVIIPDHSDYFHFDECRGMYRGYFNAMERLHTWLLSEIGRCE